MFYTSLLKYRPSIKLITGFVSVCTLVQFSFVSASFSTENSSQIIARVNGVPLYSDDIAPGVEKRIAQYQKMGSKLSPDQLRKQFQLKELDGMIGRELLAQAGDSLKPKDVEARLEKRLAAHSPKEIDSKTREDLRKQTLQEIFLEQKGLLNLKVDEQELLGFYEKNRKSFVESKSVKAQHILIRLPQKPTAAQTLEARQKAEMALSELKKGKEFAEVARRFSDSPNKENGGDLGVIKENYVSKEFDAVAFTLKPGEISDIVNCKDGLHIIRVEEQFPKKQMSFPEVKQFIAGYLQKDYQQRKINELVQELKKNATIEILIK